MMSFWVIGDWLCTALRTCLICLDLMFTHEYDMVCGARWNPREEKSHVLVSTGDDGFVKLWHLVM